MAEKRVISKLNLWTSGLVMVAMATPVGCAHRGNPAYQIQGEGRESDPGQPVTIAGDGERAELPPHRFAPPRHEPNNYQRPRSVSLSALPKLEQSNKCFNAGAVEEGQRKQVATRTRTNKDRAKKKPSGSFVPYAAQSKGEPATATPAPQPEPVPTSKPAKVAPKPAEKNATAPSTPPASAPGSSASAADTSFANNEVGAEDEAAAMEPSGESMSPSADMDDSFRSEKADRGTLERDRKKSHRKAEREQRRLDRVEGRRGDSSAPLASTERSDGPSEVAQNAQVPRLLPPVIPPESEGWGQALYLSNDDSMSLSSAQRINFAIDEFLPLDPSDIRKHEILNWAFGDLQATVAPDHVFAVDADFAPTDDENEYALAVAVHGRRLTRDLRRNAALTLVVDESGSMKAEGRMEYLKRGLLRMARELKSGDVVNLVAFDHRVCPRLSNFVVGRDDMSILTRAILNLKPRGSTNIHAGLTEGYTRADRSFQPTYSNRVMLITDALANKGVTDARTMSMVTDFHDSRRIRLSGVGVGKEFNDHLLDELTEKGRGAYVFLGSEEVVDDVFGTRFVSLIETVANDVHFRLHLPPTLRVERFHGEESSSDKAEVQAVHFFANNSQVLLSDVEAWEGKLRPEDEMMLEVEYQDPQDGALRHEFHVLPLDRAIQNQGALATNAQLIVRFSDAITQMASMGQPAGAQARAGGWRDPQAAALCSEFREEFVAFGEAAWKNSALNVWDRYCSRYDQSFGRRPSRKH